MTDSGVRPGDNYECVTCFTTRAELRFNDKIFGLSSESMMEIHLITSPIPQLQTPKGSAFQHKLLFRVIIFKILAKRLQKICFCRNKVSSFEECLLKCTKRWTPEKIKYHFKHIFKTIGSEGFLYKLCVDWWNHWHLLMIHGSHV